MLLAQGEEGLGAAAVLRRGAAGSAAAPRVAPAWASRLDGLNAQVVPPGAQVGEERVVVGEVLAHPQPETAQPDGVRVLGGPEALPVTGGILGAADSEAVQVFTAPAERGLHKAVQLGQRGGRGHLQLPPDQRADAGEHHPQPVDLITLNVLVRSMLQLTARVLIHAHPLPSKFLR